MSYIVHKELTVKKAKLTNGILYCLLLCISFSLTANGDIPEPLKPWVSWVQKGNENLSCPFINQSNYANKNNHICAWPSTLSLDVTARSAIFSQSWKVLTTSMIPLPGNDRNWPLSVIVNSKSVPVINHQGQPSIQLDKGNFIVEGKFEWLTVPDSIAIPEQYGSVNMTINNRVVAFPKIERNSLWLQKFESNQAQNNSIDISVARHVSDGAYIRLETYVSINVSGKMREVKLGQFLPEGFELIGIDANVPSFVDGDGILRAKLKPGSWTVIVYAYAEPTLLEWKRPQQSNYWPADEIWVFKGDEQLRLGKIEGAKMVDNSQAKMPKHWYKLPSYLMTTNTALQYDIQHRGKPLHLENQLRLQRTLWLSFDSSSYTFNDHIQGDMINDWRLGMKAPYLLESAEDQDGSVLITSNEQDERGIENRYPQVNVKARGVLSAEKTLLVTGWEDDFEKVSLIINLPPGNKLFAVFGADNVSNSWWGNWTIWASFIVLLSSLMASRLINITAGVATGLMLLFIYQEGSAPVLAIINLLVAIGIKKHQPFERINKLVKTYWVMSVALAVGAILLFSAMQLRTVIHPQLELRESSVEGFNEQSQRQIKKVSDPIVQRKESASHALMESAVPEKMMSSRLSASKDKQPKATYEQKAVNSMMERYQSDALMQAGSGIPNWQWNSYQVQWSSPVAIDQTFDVLILSKGTYRVIKIMGVLLTLLWLLIVLKEVISYAYNQFQPKAIASTFALVLLIPSYSPTIEAADFPDTYLLEELKSRVTQAPLCAPHCATINRAEVTPSDKSLTLALSIHANADTAVAIPKSEFWRAEKLSINGKKINTLFKRRGWIYLPIAKGISTIILQGQVAPVDVFQLEFKDNPKHVVITENKAWEVLGSQENRLSGSALEFVATLKVTKGDESVSTRYKSKPFVKVTRELSVDQVWAVHTRIERIAPSSGSINVKIPTLVGENIISADLRVKNNFVEVTIPAGEHFYTWDSTIKRQPSITLRADAEQPLIEHWRVVVSPAWHAKLSGLPVILEEQSKSDYFTYSFYPYSGERLTVDVTRPSAVKGHVLAVDSVNYTINQGTRTSTLELLFDYRSTRGGEHVIALPLAYQLKEVSIDNKLINLQLEAGKLTLPILPGRHKVKVKMRTSASQALMFSAPEINLNAPVSNITSIINLSDQRWVLWAKGPLLGPAVLYWGELFVFILLALLVSRVKFSPLSTPSWIALGFGLSLHNWGVLMLIAVWFASVTVSRYRTKETSVLAYNFSQFLLYSISIVAILSLLSAVPMSLLSSPSMGIEGNYSFGNNLQWFSDKSVGLLPTVSVLSIPTLFYKGLMLVWVIWLSFALLGWIKWVWKALGEQGYWKNEPSKVIENTALAKQSSKETLQEDST